MYRLVIADDNPWDREGIAASFDWRSMDIEVVGTCANGVEVLEGMEHLRPDILITDILMPGLNGIDLVQKLREKGSRCRVIFMSSYSEFDYARSAIDLDIHGYVLKPVVPGDLQRALGRVLADYRSEDESRTEREILLRRIHESIPMLLELFFRDLVFGVYTEEGEIRQRLEFLGIRTEEFCEFQVAAVEIAPEVQTEQEVGVDRKYITLYQIRSIIEQFSGKGLCIWPVQTSVHRCILVVFIEKGRRVEEQLDIMDLVVGIKESIANRLQLGTVIGLSNASEQLADIPALYEQAMEAVKTRFYGDKSPIICYREIENARNEGFAESINLQELYREIQALISYGEREEIEAFADRVLGNQVALQTEAYVKSIVFTIADVVQIILVNSGESFKSIFGEELVLWQKLERFETIRDIRRWLCNILISVRDYLDHKHGSTQAQMVEKIKDIIHRRYQEQLTVNDISREIFFSAIHANNIFKRETGMTIFDYLTEYRIEKAKELLKDSLSRIYLVAQQVGYANKSHFCLVFRKYTGISPTEFKNKAALR